MKKRFLAFALAFVMIVSQLPLSALAVESSTELPEGESIAVSATEPVAATKEPVITQGYLSFKLNDDGKSYSVSDCDESATGEIMIPSQIKNLPVTSIGWYAFSYCYSLSSIAIPDSITSIGGYAFDNCSSLTSITIPDSVTSIGAEAFSGCTSLTGIWIDENNAYYSNDSAGVLFDKNKTKLIQSPGILKGSYIIPDSVIGIEDAAFSNCTVLTSVAIPDSVTSIGNNAFFFCTGLTSITIPNSVTSIGVGAFDHCTGLTSTIIGNGVTSIIGSMFMDCTSLTSITIPKSVTSIGDWAFSGCTSLTNVTFCGSQEQWNNISISSGNTALTNATLQFHNYVNGICSICGSGTSVAPVTDWEYTIADGQVIITGYTGSATELVIPSQIENLPVTGIGYSAFRECTNLTGITIPDGVISIGDSAFYGCTSLTNVTIPNSVTSISDYAFCNCTNLTSISIPDSVTTINWHVFHGCTSLANIVIPNTVTSVGNSAFYGCSSLSSIVIPDSVTSIGQSVFVNCSSLTGIWVDQNNGYYSCDEDGVLFDKNKTTLIQAPGALSGSYVVPNDVTTIATEAFYGCKGLGDILIPDGVSVIGGYAFSDCTSLTDIIIPNSITNIKGWAFYNCINLSNVVFSGTKEQWNNWNNISIGTGNTALTDAPITFTEHEHKTAKPATCTEPETCSICGIQIAPATGHTFGEGSNKCTVCGFVLEWKYTISNGEVTISGYTGSATELVIPSQIENLPVTGIGDYAFCDWTNLTSIAIPDTVTSIGEGAFANCTGLTSITIPDIVTSIGDYAFSWCTGLTNITIPNSVASFGSHAFSYCTGLTSITIPDSVTCIEYGAFSYCTGLTDITIPNSVTRINDAFSYCTGLTNVIFCGTQEQWNNISISSGNTALTNATLQFHNYVNGICSICGSGTAVAPATDWEYTIADGQVTITGYTGSATELVIPAQIENLPVTSIGDRAFANCVNLTTITIPNSVMYIGVEAFDCCWGLTAITIPDSVTTIGDYAFINTVLNSITIPYSVTHIGKAAFPCGVSMTGIWVDENNAYYSNDPDGVLFDKNKTKLIQAPGALKGSYIIPDGVTVIGDYAFRNCTNLTSITIPDSVTNVGIYAFSYCIGLTSIIIPDSVTSIDAGAFSNCTGLTTITIPDSVTSIESYAFRDCIHLTSITIPDSVTSIGMYAFDGCTELIGIWVDENNANYSNDLSGVIFDKNKTKLIQAPVAIKGSYIIPDGVTVIGDYAFSDCTGLTNITIPNSVARIEKAAFSNCTDLTNVTFCGTQEQWNKISIESGNTTLTNATINYLISKPLVLAVESDSSSVTAGNTITVSVVLKENPEILAANFQIVWDSNVFEFVSTDSNGSAFDAVVANPQENYSRVVITVGDPMGGITYPSQAIKITGTGKIVDLTFKVKEDVDAGSIGSIYIANPSYVSLDGVSVETVKTTDFQIKIGNNEHVHKSVAIKIPATFEIPYEYTVVYCSDPQCPCDDVKATTVIVGGTPIDVPVDVKVMGGHVFEMLDEEWRKDGLTFVKISSVVGMTLDATKPCVAHFYEVDSARNLAPTCTEAGEEFYVCTHCLNIMQVALPALGHNYTFDYFEWKAGNENIAQPSSSSTKINGKYSCTATTYLFCANGCGYCTKKIAIGHVYYDEPNFVMEEPNCLFSAGEHYCCVVCCGEDDLNCTDPALHGKGHKVANEVKPNLTNLYPSLVAAKKIHGDAIFVINTLVGDCTKTGVSEYSCTVCNTDFWAKDETTGRHYNPDALFDSNGHCKHGEGVGTFTCVRCNEVVTQNSLVITDVTVAPTCSTIGLTEGKHCDLCGEVLVKQDKIPAIGHTEMIDTAVAPTCNATGLTEGSHCTVCGKVLVKQEVISAIGHSEVIDKGVAHTCTATGLTEGKHCSVCGEILVAQTEIPASGHIVGGTMYDEEKDEVVSFCAICGAEIARMPAPCMHTETEMVDGFASTCYRDGLSDGEKCVKCGEFVIPQKVIPAYAHCFDLNNPNAVVKSPDFCTTGEAIYKCINEGCSYEKVVIVEAAGHNLAQLKYVAEVASNCRMDKPGIKAHFECDYCKAMFVEDDFGVLKTVTAADLVTAVKHSDVILLSEQAPSCTQKGYRNYSCMACDAFPWIEDVIVAKGHTTLAEVLAHDADSWLVERDGKWLISVMDRNCIQGTTYTWTCHNPLCGSQEANDMYGYGDAICGEVLIWEDVTSVGHKELSIKIPATAQTPYNYTATYCTDPECPYPKVRTTVVNVYGVPVVFNVGVKVVGGHVYELLDEEFVKNGMAFVKIANIVPVDVDPEKTCSAHFFEIDAVRNMAPTCTKSGEDVYICNQCNEILKVAVPALGHDYNYDYFKWNEEGIGAWPTGSTSSMAEKPHKCTGVIYLQCANGCGVGKKYSNGLGHVYNAEPDFIVEEPNCQYSAGEHYLCVVCSNDKVVNEIKANITNLYDSIKDAEKVHGVHGSLVVTGSAYVGDCETIGLTEYECTACASNFWVKDETTGRHWNPDAPYYEEATCDYGKGYGEFQCIRCMAIVPAENEPLEHILTKVEAVKATCTTDGSLEYYICSRECCQIMVEDIDPEMPGNQHGILPIKYVFDESIKRYVALPEGSHIISSFGHNISDTVVAANCATPGFVHSVCMNSCGMDYITDYVAPTGHKKASAINNIVPGCEYDGMSYYLCLNPGCSGDDGIFGTSDDGKTEITIIPALGHKNLQGQYFTNKCTDTVTDRSCVVCIQDVERNHDIFITEYAPTCDKAGYRLAECKNGCGLREMTELAPSLGHTPGQPVVDPVTNDTVTFCTVCGAEISRVCKHAVTEKIAGVAPTCQKDGLTEGKKCSVCGEILVAQETIPATGHTPGQMVLENQKPASYTEAGSYDEVVCCSVCGEEISRKTVVIPMLTGAAAEINGVGYSTLQAAINAAEFGQTVKLLKNISRDTTIIIPTGKDLTIDFNGFSYTVVYVIDGAVLVVEEGAEVELTDSKGGSYLKVEYAAWQQFMSVIKNNGELTLGLLTLNGNNLHNAGSAGIINNGDLIMTDYATVLVAKTATHLQNNGNVYKKVDTNSYHWTAEGKMELHEYESTQVAATAYEAAHILHKCSCGHSYKSGYTGDKLTAAVKNLTTGAGYYTLQEAINAAKAGETIQLQKDFRNITGIVIPGDKDVTIDFNGHYYTVNNAADGSALVVEEGATVKLTNLRGSAYIKVEYAAWEQFMSVIKNNGKLTIENVTLNGANLNNTGSAAIINNGELTLNAGAEVSVKKATWISNTGVVINESSASLAAPNGYHWNDTVLEAHVAGKVQIENQKPGSYDEVTYCAVCNVEMSRRTVTAAVVTNPVAQVNGVGYATLQEAINAAADGQTVKLLKNLRNNTGIYVSGGKNVVIDLNGYYFTSNCAVDGAVIVIEEGATAKLTDSRGGGYVKVEYSAWQQFNCVIKNIGTLIVEGITVNGANLNNTGAAGIINDGTLTLNGVTISVKKAVELQNNGVLN